MEFIENLNFLIGIYATFAVLYLIASLPPKPLSPSKTKKIKIPDKRYTKTNGYREDTINKSHEEYEGDCERHNKRMTDWNIAYPKVSSVLMNRSFLLFICIAIGITLKSISKQGNQDSEKVSQNVKNTDTTMHKKIENLGDGWNRFHHKYGFYLELPNNFRATVLANSGLQWYQIDSDFESFVVTVETMGGGDKKYLEQSYQTYLQDKNIPYKAIYDNWYVVSGYQDENTIFYKKTFFKYNQTHFLNIIYKNNKKQEVEPLLDRIQKSFK